MSQWTKNSDCKSPLHKSHNTCIWLFDNFLYTSKYLKIALLVWCKHCYGIDFIMFFLVTLVFCLYTLWNTFFWLSEHNLLESALFSHHSGSEILIQVVTMQKECFYSKIYLTVPIGYFWQQKYCVHLIKIAFPNIFNP